MVNYLNFKLFVLMLTTCPTVGENSTVIDTIIKQMKLEQFLSIDEVILKFLK